MWVKQGRYIRIITYGALLSLPNLQGTRYDVNLCMYLCLRPSVDISKGQKEMMNTIGNETVLGHFVNGRPRMRLPIHVTVAWYRVIF